MNNFRFNLIIARKAKKLTQRDVATAVGVTDGCYAHWEQGRTEPKIDYIIKLCSILEIASDDLLGIRSESTSYNE